ncbi:MAG TPA: hypothetical protein VIO32_11410 [Candidatus Baltobacteraceae bacterium]
MSKHYTNDELERALFALDLEEAPSDLRSTILARTIYHVPPAASVRPWEVWLYGALCAALVWLLVAVVRGAAGPVVDSAASYGHQAVTLFSQPATLFWIAVGGAAVMISQMNLTDLPGVGRAARR